MRIAAQTVRPQFRFAVDVQVELHHLRSQLGEVLVVVGVFRLADDSLLQALLLHDELPARRVAEQVAVALAAPDEAQREHIS